MKNSEKFIECFKEIEQFINRLPGIKDDWSFTNKIRNVPESNSIVKRYKDDLISFAYLRNAISHHPKDDNKVIAEPRGTTVDLIMKIKSQIINPKKVVPIFQFDVYSVNESSNILDLIKEMKKQSFSQVPYISETGEMEIITTNTIARWLAEQIDEYGTILVENTKVSSLLDHIEFENNYKLVGRNTTVVDAYTYFESHIEQHNRHLDAIMITENGKPHETLIGLITIDDLSIEMNKL